MYIILSNISKQQIPHHSNQITLVIKKLFFAFILFEHITGMNCTSTVETLLGHITKYNDILQTFSENINYNCSSEIKNPFSYNTL